MAHNAPHIPYLDSQYGPEGQPPADIAFSAEEPTCPRRLPTTGAGVLVLRTRASVVAAMSSRDFGIAAVDQDTYVTAGSAFRSDADPLRLDPPDTTDLRRSFASCFSEPAIKKWQPGLQKAAQGLAAGVLSDVSASSQPVDLIENYTEPFMEEAGTSTLGVTRNEWPNIINFSNATLGPVEDMSMRADVEKSWDELYAYCDRLVQKKRDQPDGSIFFHVVRSMDKADKTQDEIVHTGATLMIGFPSPQPVLDVAIFELLRRPEVVKACLADSTLWEPTVKELLRYKAHFTTVLPRIALKDVQVDDIHIPEGTVVLPSLTAAAHDPASTERPDEFDIHQQASRNIVFGTGAHLCPGAALSRQWLNVCLEELFTAVPQLRLAVDESEISWKSGGIAAPESIPVTA
jgi:cytochrome P450